MGLMSSVEMQLESISWIVNGFTTIVTKHENEILIDFNLNLARCIRSRLVTDPQAGENFARDAVLMMHAYLCKVHDGDVEKANFLLDDFIQKYQKRTWTNNALNYVVGIILTTALLLSPIILPTLAVQPLFLSLLAVAWAYSFAFFVIHSHNTKQEDIALKNNQDANSIRNMVGALKTGVSFFNEKNKTCPERIASIQDSRALESGAAVEKLAGYIRFSYQNTVYEWSPRI